MLPGKLVEAVITLELKGTFCLLQAVCFFSPPEMQSSSLWTLVPATAHHKQKHRGRLLQSSAGRPSWLSLGSCLTGMASHTEETIFHAVARRCGYIPSLLISSEPQHHLDQHKAPAKCSRHHRVATSGQLLLVAFKQHFSRVPQVMVAAK